MTPYTVLLAVAYYCIFFKGTAEHRASVFFGIGVGVGTILYLNLLL